MSTKTKTDKQNTRLPNLIQYFEVCNQSEGKSPKTVSWYSANLRRFHRYLKSRHLPDSVADLDIQTLREYVLYLQKQKKFADHSPASIHGHVRTLRAFFSWLAREGLVESNLGSSLKPPKIPRKIVSTLSDEEIRSILNMLRATNPCDARNRSIVMILIDTG
jgi:site-specific recombinase XerD